MPPKPSKPPKRRMATVTHVSRSGKHTRRNRARTVNEWRDSWLRVYKAAACAAVFCVLWPAFGILNIFGIGADGLWPAGACLFVIGYLFHWLLRRLFVRDTQEVSFNFETKWTKSPPPVFAGALLVSVGAGLAAGYGSGQLTLFLTHGDAVNVYPAPMLVCTVMAIAGCVTVPAQFHQICSLRTMLECLSAMAVPFAFQLAAVHRVTTESAVCMLIYALCLFVLMNQEYIIRPSYSSATCYAPREMRLRGIGRAVGFWFSVLGAALLVVGLLSLLVTPVRYLIYETPAEIFGFPFRTARFPWVVYVNGILFLVGLLELPTASVLFILYMTRRAAFARLKQAIDRLRERLAGWMKWVLSGGWRNKVNYGEAAADTVREAPKRTHYVDTVTRTERSDDSGLRPDRAAFARTLKSLPDTDARFRYAYEVLITNLADAHIGVSRSQTPLEAAAVVAGKTNIREIDALTATYAAVTYGRDSHADEADLARVCGIVGERLTR